jgi:hypothetical protein
MQDLHRDRGLLPLSFYPPLVRDVVLVLRDLPVAWAIAGGWAVDLVRGSTSRGHADVDVVVFRDDQIALREALPAWQFEVVISGAPVPWARGERLELPVHEVHARISSDHSPKKLEFLLNERDRTDWIYRRDPTIR